MPISQASEMVQRAANHQQLTSSQRDQLAIIRQHDCQLDQQSLERIARLIQQQITPLVSIETLDPKPWAGHPRHQSETLLCDITGVAHLFGGEEGLLAATAKLLADQTAQQHPAQQHPAQQQTAQQQTAQQHQARSTKDGLRCRMAIADSVGAAWAIAHYGRTDTGLPHFIAPPGDQESAIAPLAVESLRIPVGTVETLARLGITKVGQLLQLPRSGLAPRLGNHLVERIALALAEVEEPLIIHRAEAEHRQTLLMQYPTSDQKILADRVERLMAKIRAGLATRQRGALRLACRLDLSAHPPLTFEIGLFAPTVDEKHLSGLIIHRLESKKLPALVERLTLEVTLSGPLRSVQTALFDDESSNAHTTQGSTRGSQSLSGSPLSRLIDSLTGLLGRDAVVGVKMEDNPLPEKAFTALPLAGNSKLLQKQGSSSALRSRGNHESLRRLSVQDTAMASGESQIHQPTADDPLRRPCALLTQPIPLVVAFEDGKFHRNVTSSLLPTRIRLAGDVHAIQAHWGPERIETGWWRGPSIRRDYYRIETDQGRWWWIFRNLTSKDSSNPNSSKKHAATAKFCWMLHGRFD